MRIFVFGDSIGQGFFDSHGGWVQRLANDFHSRTLKSMSRGEDNWTVLFNQGISGDTAEGVLHRMKPEVEARRMGKDEEMIVIAIGTNDAILRENHVVTDVYDFQETLEHLADGAHKLTDNVVFVGLPAVDEAQTNPWKHSSTGKQWFNERLNLFEDAIKQVAFNKDAAFIPAHDEFIKQLQEGKDLLSDGLHPNDKGHQLIYDIVKPELEELLK